MDEDLASMSLEALTATFGARHFGRNSCLRHAEHDPSGKSGDKADGRHEAVHFVLATVSCFSSVPVPVSLGTYFVLCLSDFSSSSFTKLDPSPMHPQPCLGLSRYLQTRLTPLPLECLQLVFRTIADGRDSNTLTALLRCNSYFFEATIPFLYGDPLDLLLEYSSQPLHQKTSQLLTLLLFCTSVELQSELLQARFDLRFLLNRIQAPL